MHGTGEVAVRPRTPRKPRNPAVERVPNAPSVPPRQRGNLLSVAGALVLVFGAFAVMLWLTSDPSRQAIVQRLIESPMGLVVLFGLAALSTATLILPAPGLALTAIAGAAGDPILVGAVAGLGQAVGELTGYVAGSSGRVLLPANAWSARILDWLRRRGVLVIFVLALVPNPLFDVAGIAAGVARMPLARYLGSAVAGKVIKNWLIAGGASTLGAALGVLGVLGVPG